MPEYIEPTKQYYLSALKFIALFATAVTAGAFLLLPRYWYAWVMSIIAGIYLLVAHDARNTAYRCAGCGNVFEISVSTDLVSPHGFGRRSAWKYLRCPDCGAITRSGGSR